MGRALYHMLAAVLVVGMAPLLVSGFGGVSTSERGVARTNTPCRSCAAPADSAKESIRSPRVYEEFLSYLNDPEAGGERFAQPVVRRQLGALFVVLPDRMIERLHIRETARTGHLEILAEGAGHDIMRWWRRQDPYPATGYNERLREHLRRTATAFEQFSREDNPNRLDDRGKVYVRLGPPDRKREIDVGHEGAFWVYASHSAAEYVFIRDRGNGHKIGPPTDLLPENLRHGFGPSPRGLRKAVRSLSILEHVYGRLAHFRSRYGITFSDLSMYKEQVRQAMDGLPTSLRTRPHTFVEQKIQEIQHEEAEASRRREEIVPQTQSNAANQFEELPVAARWMRSLREDGTTEVELYWSISRSSLRVSEERADRKTERKDQGEGGYLLSASLVRFTKSYERREVHTSHLFASHGGEEKGVLPSQRETFALAGTPHAALQVDLTWASVGEEGTTVHPRAKLKVGTTRVDSLSPLDSDPSVLEMSDLQPVLWGADSTSVEKAPVYPFRNLTSTASLALRFEVYHLSTGTEGRTRYTVKYEVLRKTNRGGARLFRGNEQKRTAVASRFEGEARRTSEYVLVDLANWQGTNTQTVRVTVEVTDERTGEKVARSIAFELPQGTSSFPCNARPDIALYSSWAYSFC